MAKVKTADDYTYEMEGFAGLMVARWKCEAPKWVSYSGGVPGMSLDLGDERYEEVKIWLTMLYGESKPKSRWHPSHRRGSKPLFFKKTKRMKINCMDHVWLIQKGTLAHKRHITISWM